MIRGHLPENRFALPGGWFVGDTPSDSRRFAAAVLRPLCGHEEQWVALHGGAPSPVVTSRLLDTCVIRLDDEEPPRGFSRRMLVGDRDYLILQLRRLTLGDQILAVVDCPVCRAKMDVDFDAAAIATDGAGKCRPLYEVDLPERIGYRARTVRFRLPTGADQEAVVGLDIETASEKLLERCLVDGAATLEGEEKALVILAMEQRAPRIEIELDLKCPECAHSFEMPFDTTTFFFDEIRISADQLLREIHFLALYYHWSETEILNLERQRRRAYLSLLSDSLRRE